MKTHSLKWEKISSQVLKDFEKHMRQKQMICANRKQKTKLDLKQKTQKQVPNGYASVDKHF